MDPLEEFKKKYGSRYGGKSSGSSSSGKSARTADTGSAADQDDPLEEFKRKYQGTYGQQSEYQRMKDARDSMALHRTETALSAYEAANKIKRGVQDAAGAVSGLFQGDLTRAGRAYEKDATRAAEDASVAKAKADLYKKTGDPDKMIAAKQDLTAAKRQMTQAGEDYSAAWQRANNRYYDNLKGSDLSGYYGETLSAREISDQLHGLRQMRQQAAQEAEQAEADWQYYLNDENAQSYDIARGKAEKQLSDLDDEIIRYETALRYRNYLDRTDKIKANAERVTKRADFDALARAGQERALYDGVGASEKQKAQELFLPREEGGSDPDDPDFYVSARMRKYGQDVRDNYMTDEQRKIYYALYISDKQAAKEYADLIHQQGWAAELNAEAEWAGTDTGTRIAALLKGTFYQTAAGLDPFGEFGQKLTQEGQALITGGGQGLKEKGLFNSGALSGEWDILGGKSLADAYQLGSSMLQSTAVAVPSMLIGGPAGELLGGMGTALLGSSAAAADYNECIQRGLSKDQAKVHALAAGTAEALFEYVSLDKLVNQDLTRGFIKNFLLQGGIEASEEACTTIANRLSDGALAAMSGYDNSLEARKKEMISKGYERSVAEKMANQEWATELVNDALGGFWSGGIMTGTHYGVNKIASKVGATIYNNRVDETNGAAVTNPGEAAALRSYAEENGIELNEAALRGLEARSQTETVSENAERRDALPAVENADRAETNKAAAEQAAPSETETSRSSETQLEKKGLKERLGDALENQKERKSNRSLGSVQEQVVSRIAETVHERGLNNAQAVYDEQVSKHGEGITRSVQEAVKREASLAFREIDNQETLKNAFQEAVRGVTAKPVQDAIRAAYQRQSFQVELATGKARTRSFGLDVEVRTDNGTETAQIVGLTPNAEQVKLSNGQTAAPSELVSIDADTRDILDRIAYMEVGPAADSMWQAFQLEAWSRSQTENYQWIMDYTTAFDQGRTGKISMEEATSRSGLDPRIAVMAYEQGQDAKREMTREQQNRLAEKRARAEKGATGRKGILDTSAVSEKTMKRLSKAHKQQLQIVEKISEALGVDVKLYDSTVKDGQYQGENGRYSDGVIWLDINAGRNSVRDIGSGILAVTGHELTHWMQEFAPAAYADYRDAVVEAIVATKGEEEFERLVWQARQNSEKKLSRTEAIDEVVADASMERMGDAAFWNAVADSLGQERKTVAEKVRQFFSEWFQRIRDALSKTPHMAEAAKVIDQAEAQIQEALRQLYAAGIREAAQTAREIGETKNAAQKGDGKYSTRQEVLALENVDWMEDNSSIKDQLEKHRQEISEMAPVAEISYIGETKKDLVDLIMEQIPHIGGSRIKRDSVIFDFDRGGAEAIVAHAKSPELRAAAVAATYITKRGKLIAGQKNHEGNKTTTLTFAAPVIINGESAHVGVVIQFTRNGRPHAVNIEAVDPTTGEATVFKLKEAAKGLDRRSTKSMVTVLPTIAASDNNLPQSNGKSKPYYEKKSSRDRGRAADLDLIMEAAENLSEAGGEEYWKALLESAPELEAAAGLKGSLKEFRDISKRLIKTEEALEKARHDMTLTQRKLNTGGIGEVARGVIREFGISDAKNNKIAQRATQIITETYQNALDQIDSGNDADVMDTLYNGAVRAAELLLDEGRYTQNNGGKWTNVAFSRYIGEDRQAVIDKMVADVGADFAANRYRAAIPETAADRLVARTEARMQAKLDDVKAKAAQLREENRQLSESNDFVREQYDAARDQVGQLTERLQELRAEIKDTRTMNAQEQKAANKRIDRLEAQLESKKQEAAAWRARAERNASLLESALKSKSRDVKAALEQGQRQADQALREKEAAVRKLEAQRDREQQILEGKLKPPAMQRLLKAVREQASEKMRARKEEQYARYKEGRKTTELRGRIRNLHDEMRRDLLKPREGHFVPEELVKSVTELLEMVSTDKLPYDIAKLQAKIEKETNPARLQELEDRMQNLLARQEKAAAKIDAINAAYDRIKNDERYSMYYDETVKGMLAELSGTLSGRSIYSLNADELEDVYTVMKAMRTTIRNSIKADLIEEGKQTWEIGNALRQELRAGKGASPYLLEKYHMTMLSAERAFHRFGNYQTNSTWDKVFRMLDDAQLRQLTLEMKATRIFDPVLKTKADFKRAEALTSIKEKDLVDVGLKDADGNPVKITRGMMLSLYMHLQNEENMRHLMYGGLTLPDFRRYYKGNPEAWGRGTVEIPALGAKVSNLDALLEEQGEAWVNEQYRAYEDEIRELFESVRQNIEEQLSNYDRKWIAASKDFFDDFSRRELNAVTNAMYGFSKAKVDNYFPIVTDSNFLKSEFDSISRNISLENAGFMKERVRAGNPILLEDITRAVNRQISNVSRYAGLTQALKTFGNVYNVQTRGFTDSVKKAMAKAYGKNGQEYVQNLITDMIGGRSQPGSIFDRIKGNYAQAVLSANLSVTVKQAASFPTAAATVGWGPLMKALAKGGKNGRLISRANRALIDAYTPLLWKRSQGAIDMEIGDMAHAQDWTKKAKWLMGWIEKTDIATVGRLWSAAEFYVSDNFKGLEKGTREQIQNGDSPFYQKVAEVFNRIVEDTQPNYTVLQRPDILRNPNKLVRAMTMFSTQRFQNANILIDAAGEYAAKLRADRKNSTQETKAERKTARQKLTRAISSQVVSALVLNAMTLASGALLHRMNPWRDDDDELTTESIVEEYLNGFFSSMAGSFLGGSEAYEAISALLTGSKYYSNDVGGISTVNDFLKSVVEFGQQSVKLIGDEDSTPEDWHKLAEKQLAKVGQYLAQMTGVPIGNVNKIIAGAKAHVTDARNGEFWSFEAGVERKATVNAHRFLQAWVNEDAEKMDKVKTEMLDNYAKAGKDEKDANTALKAALTAAGKKAYTADELAERDAVDFLAETGFYSPSDALDKVHYWRFQQEHPDVEISQAKVAAYYNELAAAGMPLDTYLSYIELAANATGTDQDGDGKIDSGSKKAAILEIIDGLDLDDAQKDALYYLNGYAAATIDEAPWHQ